MSDDRIELPQYIRDYEHAVAAWRETRKLPMPHPIVPKIEPDDILMMPTRDGTRLYTELFFPRQSPTTRVPAILIRTPYPDSTFPFSARPIELFRGAGYTVAIQSCRGTWKSEGRFRWHQNEPEDGFDCIETLAVQPWSDGQIGMYGSSYLGSVQWLAAKLRPPHLTCIAPQSPAAWFFYETPYVGGVLEKNHVLTWPRLVGRRSWEEMGFEWGSYEVDEESELYRATHLSPNVEALRQWYQADPQLLSALLEMFEHPTLDAWWEHIMLTAQTAAEIDIPVLAITGFHDGDQAGCLHNWELVEAHESSAMSRRHLLVGPWRHAQMGSGRIAPMGRVVFGENANVPLQKAVLRFFDAYMKNDASARTGLPQRCRLYTSGSNVWHEVSAYPPRESTVLPWYLASSDRANSIYGNGRLVTNLGRVGGGPDELPADWTLPVPSLEPGVDCRSTETRYDVLVYSSDVLTRDLTVLGPVRAVLYVAADAPDCDVIIRITDVWPTGESINMTGENGCAPFRARYRQGFDREVLLTPGEPALLQFHVCHMGHTFKQGHRLRISIVSTAANIFEPNHHTGEAVATAVERRRATERIFHDAARPSHILFPIFGGDSA